MQWSVCTAMHLDASAWRLSMSRHWKLRRYLETTLDVGAFLHEALRHNTLVGDRRHV